ncbi:MAG TPA: hypothetical protein VGR25_07995 [bacterium]|jgi:hypothetical protein|nr:hypothetical protein [bacterium]
MVTLKLQGKTLRAERAEIVFAGSGLSLEITGGQEVGGGLLVHTKNTQRGQPDRSYMLPWAAAWRVTLDNLAKS